MMRDVEIVAVCYIFIGIFGVIGNGMIVISLGKVSNALWFASLKRPPLIGGAIFENFASLLS